jgi:hypothetical protein
MSAFRMKTTSKLLQTNPPTEKKENPLFFLDIDEKSSFLNKTSSSTPRKPLGDGPKVGNNVGMAIRTVTSAQPDHM